MLSRRRFLTTAAATAPALALNPSSAYPLRPPAPASAQDLPPLHRSPQRPLPRSRPHRRRRAPAPHRPRPRTPRPEQARRPHRHRRHLARSTSSASPPTNPSASSPGRLPATGDPFIVCPTFEAGRVHEALSASPNGATTRVYTWNEDEDPYALLAKSLKAVTSSLLPLALDERVQYVFADRIAQAVAPRATTSGIPVVAGCRSIKSPAELALMQLANDITLSVYKAVYESCSPGDDQPPVHLARRRSLRPLRRSRRSLLPGRRLLRPAPRLPHPADHPRKPNRPHRRRLLRPGLSIRHVPQLRLRQAHRPPEARLRHRAPGPVRSLAAARPGVEMQAVDAAARAVITNAGFGPDYKHFTHRVGHGIGMDMHEWYYLVRGNTRLTRSPT